MRRGSPTGRALKTSLPRRLGDTAFHAQFYPPGAPRARQPHRRRMGSSAEETEEVADHLVRANLSGHDSHGVGMLPAYVRLLQDGLLVPNQTPHTVLDAGALLVIDARRGFGQRMAADAVRRAIGRARETRRLRAGAAQCLACRAHRHLWRAGRARRLRLHRLRQRRRRSRRPGAVGLRRAASRHQPVLRGGARARTGRRCCSTWRPPRSPPARRAWPTTRARRCRTTA